MARSNHSAVAMFTQLTRTHPGFDDRSVAKVGDEFYATANFIDHRFIFFGFGTDFLIRSWLEERTFVRRTTGHRQIAKSAPHLLPGDLAIRAEFQIRRTHGHRLHFFGAILIQLGQKRPDAQV